MKNVKLSLAALGVTAMSLFAFKHADTGSIKGLVTPADAATKVWVMSKTDTLSADLTQGKFEVKDLKAGTYNLVIEAKAPYKSIGKEGITVSDAAIDVGEIKLAK
ncbi:MAG: carboxypeptidase regulatory-like domain-containing protein [Chitinophagaceae bacterium]